MKKILLILLMLLPMAIYRVGAQPKVALIKMDTVAYDFGRVSRKGGDVAHTFTARNEGNSPLLITEAATTCTCLKVKYPKRPIAPNGEAQIEVKYEVRRKDEGPFHKIIKLLSNSVDGGCQVLTIHGVSVDE